MGRIRNRIIPFKVINGDINKEDFEGYDVMQYLVNGYKKVRRRKKCPKTYDEFKRWVDRELAYMFWARCQYEIVLTKADKFIEQQALIKRYDELSEEQKKMFGEAQDLLELYKSDSYNNLMCEQRETISKFYSNQQKIDVYYQLTQNSDIVMLVFLYNIGKLDLVEQLNLDSFKIMVNGENEVVEWIDILGDIESSFRDGYKKIPKKLGGEILKTFDNDLTGLMMMDWPCEKIHKELTKSFQIKMNLEILTKIVEYKLKQ
jgi:hypothetical protein